MCVRNTHFPPGHDTLIDMTFEGERPPEERRGVYRTRRLIVRTAVLRPCIETLARVSAMYFRRWRDQVFGMWMIDSSF